MFTPGPGGLLAPLPGGHVSEKSPKYICSAKEVCFRLEVQLARYALRLAAANAGSSMAAKMAMIAMTTRSSMRVKPDVLRTERKGQLDRELSLVCFMGVVIRQYHRRVACHPSLFAKS